MASYLDLQAQLADLTKKVQEAKKNEYGAAVKEIVAKIKAFEIPLKEIEAALNDAPSKARRGRPPKTQGASSPKVAAKAKKEKKPVAIKYQDGNGNTWTGRGRTPKWVTAAIENGVTLESFQVANVGTTVATPAVPTST
jgi:DNA-binding protein H-NS